jgi:HlyD family secretion protein
MNPKLTSLNLVIAVVFLSACSNNNEKSDAYGNFEVDDVIVSAEANGKLIFFNVEEGQSLNEGSLTGVVDTVNFVLQRDQLTAQKKAVASNIAHVKAQIDVLEQQKKNHLRDKKRIENLLRDGAATQKQLDDINGAIDVVNSRIVSTETQYTSVQSEMEVIRTQIAQVEESIRRCRIFNPINGRVLEKFANAGEITAFGKPLYNIADMETLTLRVYVSGAQLPRIKLGQNVEVLVDADAKKNRALNGEVYWVSETAEFTPKIIQTKEERVNMVYAVKVRVKNDGMLKIGMPGEVNF